MAVVATLMRDPQFDGEEDSIEKVTYRRTYDVGNAATLSSCNLEIGDALPEDATTEIIQSWIETNKNQRVARVVAVTFNYE